MKNLTTSAFFLLIFSTCLFAQEKSNLKNIQEETVTTTLITKGINEETTVTKTFKKGKQLIKINDTGVENQQEKYTTETSSETSKTEKLVKINTANEDAIKELKKAQQKEIEDSKKAQLLKYEAERKAMEEKRPEKFQKKNNSANNKS